MFLRKMHTAILNQSKSLLLLVVGLATSLPLIGQQFGYSLESSNAQYDTLQTYYSIPLAELQISGDPFYWDHVINLPFDLPIHGANTSSLVVNPNSEYSITNDLLEEIGIMTGEYFIRPVSDISTATYLDSDIRCSIDSTSSVRSVCIEYHNVFQFAEWVDQGENHIINYTVCFYEDGEIEVLFGPTDLSQNGFFSSRSGLG